MPRETGRTLVAQNKKARHDYQIGETYEAGLVLTAGPAGLRSQNTSLWVVDAVELVINRTNFAELSSIAIDCAHSLSRVGNPHGGPLAP